MSCSVNISRASVAHTLLLSYSDYYVTWVSLASKNPNLTYTKFKQQEPYKNSRLVLHGTREKKQFNLFKNFPTVQATLLHLSSEHKFAL